MGLVREAVRTCMHDAQSEHCPLLEEGCVVCRRACTAGTRIETTRSTAVDNETHTASPRRPGDSTARVYVTSYYFLNRFAGSICAPSTFHASCPVYKCTP